MDQNIFSFYKGYPPPAFAQKWYVTDVVRSFNEDGLKAEVKKDYTSEPLEVKEGTASLTISLKDGLAGTITTFNKKEDLEKIQKRFFDLNKNGEFHTWTFVKDNVLLVLTGSLPEDEARRYESSLYNLKN